MDALQLDHEIFDIEAANALSEEDKAFLRDVAKRIRGVAPEAELLLYGSRARGDARPDRAMRKTLFHDDAIRL